MTNVLLRLSSVKAACGLSRSELYRRIRSGDFPRPVALGSRAVAWRQSDVVAWIDSRQLKPSPIETSIQSESSSGAQRLISQLGRNETKSASESAVPGPSSSVRSLRPRVPR